LAHEDIIDSGVRKAADALNQPTEIASFSVPVEGAARQAVERAFSTAERATCNEMNEWDFTESAKSRELFLSIGVKVYIRHLMG